jgi:hypothetical protein
MSCISDESGCLRVRVCVFVGERKKGGDGNGRLEFLWSSISYLRQNTIVPQRQSWAIAHADRPGVLL